MAPIANDQNDEGADLARWLEESGRRPAIILEPAVQLAEPISLSPVRHRPRWVRRIVLLGAFAVASGQYAFFDLQLRLAKIPSNHYFVAARASDG